MKLEPPRHIALRSYRVTPSHLEDFHKHMQALLLDLGSDVQKATDGTTRLLESVYDTGFSDGYAAALLEKDSSSK